MNYKILEDIWRDDLKQFWLWCDIDGYGRQWRLAIVLEGSKIAFPHEDFDHYIDYYMIYPAREICKPIEPEEWP